MLLKERHDAVVEHVGGDKGILTVVQFGEADFGICVYHGLLVDVSHALDMTHIICVLGHKEAGVERLDLAVRLFLGLGLLEGRHLRLVQDYPLLLDFGRKCFQPLLECLQIVAQPNGAHASLRDHDAFLAKLVGNAHLSESRVLKRHLHDGVLDMFLHAVLDHGLAARYLLQCKLASLFVQLLEAVEAVAAVAHYLAGSRHVAQLLGQLKKPQFVLDDFF